MVVDVPHPAGYETPDSHTLVVKLNGPDLALISRLVYSTRIGYPAPAGYIDQVGEDGIKNRPIGTGPYKLVKADYVAEDITLEAWEDWGAYWSFRPAVKTVRLRGIPEETTRIAMLATGEADLIELGAGPQLKEVKTGTVRFTPYVGTSFLEFFKQADPTSPYGNVKVRQALNYAVNKEELIEKLLAGAASPAASPINPLQFGYPKDLQPYPYDPVKAKQLLAEAGYAGGFDGGVIFTVSSGQKVQAEAVVDYLAPVGVRIRVSPIDAGVFYGRFSKPQHSLDQEVGMGFMGSSLPGDGAYRSESFFSKYGSWGYTVDGELDSLYDKTLSVVDRAERERLLQSLARLTHEKAYKLFLWHPQAVWGLGPRIADWKPIPGLASFSRPQSIRLR